MSLLETIVNSFRFGPIWFLLIFFWAAFDRWAGLPSFLIAVVCFAVWALAIDAQTIVMLAVMVPIGLAIYGISRLSLWAFRKALSQ